MKNFLLIFLLCFPISLPVQAQVSFETLCRSLPQFQPLPGQDGPNYQPGIDVHGKAVAPADLNAPLPDLDPVRIPITIDLAEHFALDLPAGLELKPDVADLEIYQDGRITYNNQDLSRRIYSVCAGETPPAAPDGQKPPDTLKSGAENGLNE